MKRLVVVFVLMRSMTAVRASDAEADESVRHSTHHYNPSSSPLALPQHTQEAKSSTLLVLADLWVVHADAQRASNADRDWE